MITLHHLNRSRSKRIIWLLEELKLDYQIKPYLRDSVTHLAPPELKQVHPLGKSPVIENDGTVIAESGAITEYLINTYASKALAPEFGSKAYTEYSQWIHFAESSAILPLLLKLFVSKEPEKTSFLEGYANDETMKVISYFDQALENKTYLVEERLTGADIMMSFIVDILNNRGMIDDFPNIRRYGEQLRTHPALIRAEQLEQQHG
ncbi:glutathione S-transferase family protein [Vibrio profundum]|uniref:glutathione S-transferase family protein n=1 Tax=Vibrio profundum TaxID=2910247 RepID=UPI003D0D469D